MIRFLLIWAFLSLIVALIAHLKGRSAWGFFALAMVFSPPVGFLAVLLFPATAQSLEDRGLKSGALKKCPFCTRVINSSDTVCRHCNRPQSEIIDVEVV